MSSSIKEKRCQSVHRRLEKEPKEREEKSEYSIDLSYSFELNPLKNILKTTWFWLPRSTMKGNENHNDFANVLNCTSRAFITWKLVSLPTVTHINDLPCNTRRDKFLARVIKAMLYKSTTNILHFVTSKCWKKVLISNKYGNMFGLPFKKVVSCVLSAYLFHTRSVLRGPQLCLPSTLSVFQQSSAMESRAGSWSVIQTSCKLVELLKISLTWPSIFQDLNVNSPFSLLHVSLWISHQNLVFDQDYNFYLISLSILITFLLDNVWIWKGEVTCLSLLEVS